MPFACGGGSCVPGAEYCYEYMTTGPTTWECMNAVECDAGSTCACAEQAHNCNLNPAATYYLGCSCSVSDAGLVYLVGELVPGNPCYGAPPARLDRMRAVA